MQSKNRNEVKWAPFNSLMNGYEILNNIDDDNQKISKPILSDDDKENICRSLYEYYYEKEKVSLDYFYDGRIYHLDDIIKKIDSTYHKVYFTSLMLIFEQIIKVY